MNKYNHKNYTTQQYNMYKYHNKTYQNMTKWLNLVIYVIDWNNKLYT